jgi:hypothetical protein
MTTARYSSNKDVNDLVRELLRAGWTHERGRHNKLFTPCRRRFVVFSVSPSDRRDLQNMRRDIRRVCHEVGIPQPGEVTI